MLFRSEYLISSLSLPTPLPLSPSLSLSFPPSPSLLLRDGLRLGAIPFGCFPVMLTTVFQRLRAHDDLPAGRVPRCGQQPGQACRTRGQGEGPGGGARGRDQGEGPGEGPGGGARGRGQGRVQEEPASGTSTLTALVRSEGQHEVDGMLQHPVYPLSASLDFFI